MRYFWIPVLLLLASCQFLEPIGEVLAGVATSVGAAAGIVNSGGEGGEVPPPGWMSAIMQYVMPFLAWLAGKFGWIGKTASGTATVAKKTGTGTVALGALIGRVGVNVGRALKGRDMKKTKR